MANSPTRVLRDIEMDHFYRESRKRWHFPKFYRYKVGDPRRFKPLLNRYPHHVLGAGVVIAKYCYCVMWADLPTDSRGRR